MVIGVSQSEDCAERWSGDAFLKPAPGIGQSLAERKGVAIAGNSGAHNRFVVPGALDLRLGRRVWRSRFTGNQER